MLCNIVIVLCLGEHVVKIIVCSLLKGNFQSFVILAAIEGEFNIPT
jgi:hypothetical protein